MQGARFACLILAFALPTRAAEVQLLGAGAVMEHVLKGKGRELAVGPTTEIASPAARAVFSAAGIE